MGTTVASACWNTAATYLRHQAICTASQYVRAGRLPYSVPSTEAFPPSQVLWALCVYVEAVSVLPQLRMMQKAKVCMEGPSIEHESKVFCSKHFWHAVLLYGPRLSFVQL